MSKIKELLQAPLTLTSTEKTELFLSVRNEESSHDALKNPKAFTMFITYFMNKYLTTSCEVPSMRKTTLSFFTGMFSQDEQFKIFLKLLAKSDSVGSISQMATILESLMVLSTRFDFHGKELVETCEAFLVKNGEHLNCKVRKSGKITKLVFKLISKCPSIDLSAEDRPSNVAAALGRNEIAVRSNRKVDTESKQQARHEVNSVEAMLESFLNKLVAVKANSPVPANELRDMLALKSGGLFVHVADQKKLFEKLNKIIDKLFMRNGMLALTCCEAFLRNSDQLDSEVITVLSKKVAKNLTSSNEFTRAKTVQVFSEIEASKEFCEYLSLVGIGKEGKLTPAHKIHFLDALRSLKFNEAGFKEFSSVIVKFINVENIDSNVDDARVIMASWIKMFNTKISVQGGQEPEANQKLAIWDFAKTSKSKLYECLLAVHGDNLNGYKCTNKYDFAIVKTADSLYEAIATQTIQVLQNNYNAKELSKFLKSDNLQRLAKDKLSVELITFFAYSNLLFAGISDTKMIANLINYLVDASAKSNHAAKYLIKFIKKTEDDMDSLNLVLNQFEILKPSTEQLSKCSLLSMLAKEFPELKLNLTFQQLLMPENPLHQDVFMQTIIAPNRARCNLATKRLTSSGVNKFCGIGFINSGTTCAEILKLSANNDIDNNSLYHLLKLYSRIAPNVYLPAVIEHVKSNLLPKNIGVITEEDVGIMNTTPGCLYNKEKLGLDAPISKNMSADKYDMEVLKKEQELKKVEAMGGYFDKKTGKMNNKTLSKKQIEIGMAEMEVEGKVRDQMIVLESKFDQIFKILFAAFSSIEAQKESVLRDYLADYMEVVLVMESNILSRERSFVLQDLVGDPLFGNATIVDKIIHSKGSFEIRENGGTNSFHRLVALKTVEKNGVTQPKITFEHLSDKETFDSSDICRFIFTFKNYDTNSVADIKQLHTRINSIDSTQIRYLPVNTITNKLLRNLDNTKLRIVSNNCLTQVFKHLSRDKSGLRNDDALFSTLLSSTWLESQYSRTISLELLGKLVQSNMPKNSLILAELERKLFTFSNSPVEEICFEADQAFETANFTVMNAVSYAEDMFNDMYIAKYDQVQEALAFGISAINELDVGETLTRLFRIYCETTPNPSEEVLAKRKRGMKVLPEELDATPFSRMGVGYCLQNLPIEESHMQTLFDFLLSGPLNDSNAKVRNEMLETAKYALQLHGKACCAQLLPSMSQQFADLSKSPNLDALRHNLVLIMGSLAASLDPMNPQVETVMAKLQEALSIPSEQVQLAVAHCLTPLAKNRRDLAIKMMETLFEITLTGNVYATRRGAAYGIAGLAKGARLSGLKRAGIFHKLPVVFDDRKNAKSREGALMLIETLTLFLKRSYEPHLIAIMPNLLDCFGDQNNYVRQAAMDAASVVMANLTQTGVKLILPGLLDSIENSKAWRAKCAAAEMLGQMSNLSSRQLSLCLPQIVPKLQTLMVDSHQKVAGSGAEALLQIGNVVQNPEIRAISGIVIDALADPNEHANACLTALVETEFEHEIDAPSLALLMPTITKSLNQRSAEVRRKASIIICSMYQLTKKADMELYSTFEMKLLISRNSVFRHACIFKRVVCWRGVTGCQTMHHGSCTRSQAI